MIVDAQSNALSLCKAAILRAIEGAARPLVVGLCGAQGSGKSTLAEQLAADFAEAGIPTAILGIDDLYLTKAERQVLEANVHPMLATRSVPGTHDVQLGLDILAAIDSGLPAVIPRFDKAQDDRAPEREWRTVEAGTRLVIFEGWCVGARPQPAAALAEPLNALEREQDRDGRWRQHVNDALAGAYQQLFARIDLQILLAAPGFEVVHAWRLEQEAALARTAAPGATGIMSDAEIGRFIQHYERLTRHILAEMPARADLVLKLDARREVSGSGPDSR